MTFTLKWGILGPGGIAKVFAKDLLADPATRNVKDLVHQIVAVGSSSSTSKSEQFIADLGVSQTAKAYGNYKDLVEDKNVDIVYVATPHTFHYPCVKLALESGKHVLCEKPFTINAKQAEKLIEIARQNNLFLMEAVWIRYFPLVLKLQELVFQDKIIGDVKRVSSDLSAPFDIDQLGPKHRIFAPELGGGALLDLGLYSLTWVLLMAYDDPRNNKKAPIVSSGILKNPVTHVDDCTNISLIFNESHVSATANSSSTVKSHEPAVTIIQGEKGEITIGWPTYRPEKFTVHLYPEGTPKEKYDSEQRSVVKEYDFPIPGHGMFWEADECARCIRDGLKESPRMPLKESVLAMDIFDQVRKQNDFVFPKELEAAD